MMIMPGNNLSSICHYFAGRYPGQIGILNSPKYWTRPPVYFPWALDNGAFHHFDPDLFINTLHVAKTVHPPLWVAVPDVVCNPEETLRLWHFWWRKIDFPLAFVCQDGHEPQDVPKEAICCFIGGSTHWKIENAYKFKSVRRLLHIGRVNTIRRLRWAKDIGADSVDGTGFFRAGPKHYYNLLSRRFEGDKERNICSLF